MKCAWCNPDDHEGTHGICDKHAVQVLQQHRERRAAKRQQQQRDKSYAQGHQQKNGRYAT